MSDQVADQVFACHVQTGLQLVAVARLAADQVTARLVAVARVAGYLVHLVADQVAARLVPWPVARVPPTRCHGPPTR